MTADTKISSDLDDVAFVDKIIAFAETQEQNVFNTYSPLWSRYFSEREKITPEVLTDLLHTSQSSGIAGHSRNPELFAKFYASLIEPALLDAFPISPVGRPETFDFLGHPVSVTYLENLAAFAKLLSLDKLPNQMDVLEIGAGYGAFAHLLMQTGKVRSYTIVDLPENAANSAFFLSRNHPEMPLRICAEQEGAVPQSGINLVLAGHIKAIDRARFDLAINTDSLGEMLAETAAAYVAFVFDHLRDGGVFFSKNGHRRGRANGVQRVSEFGYGVYKLKRLRPAMNASSVYDDFSHIVLLGKDGGPMTDAQVRDLDTLANVFALGLHDEMSDLSDAVAAGTVDDEGRKFLDWAERYFAKAEGPYDGSYRASAGFMEGLRAAANGRPAAAAMRDYLAEGRSWAACAYAYLILSKGDFDRLNVPADRIDYFLAEVMQLRDMPRVARDLAYRIRVDNLRKKVDLDWKPSALRRIKDIALNLREGRFSSVR